MELCAWRKSTAGNKKHNGQDDTESTAGVTIIKKWDSCIIMNLSNYCVSLEKTTADIERLKNILFPYCKGRTQHIDIRKQ